MRRFLRPLVPPIFEGGSVDTDLRVGTGGMFCISSGYTKQKFDSEGISMLKITASLLATGLLTAPAAHFVVPQTLRHSVESQQGPRISARAAILVNARTGAIMYEKNAFKEMDPASVTKMMTAMLIIEHGHLQKIVTVSPKAAYTIGSALHISPGDRYTEKDLLYGLLMRSGNDASVALAEADAGSVQRFVAQMNVEAQKLGAFNTQFENPNGLTKPGHFSTAYDLALIARQAMRLSLFRQIVATREGSVKELRHHEQRTLHNTNQLLYSFPGANGIKTGTTDAAGKCLVASAARNGESLIAVLLHSQDRYGDAHALLRWGFEHWSTTEVLRPGTMACEAAVAGGKEGVVPLEPVAQVWLALPNQETYETYFARLRLKAPVQRHQAAGYVTIVAGGQPAQVVALRTMRSVAAQPLHSSLWSKLKSLFTFGG